MNSQSERRPLIGLTVGFSEPATPEFLHIRHTYPDAVVAAGGTPVLIPPMEDADALRQIYSMLDAMVFPGGLDVHANHFADKQHPTAHSDAALDGLELQVAAWAIADTKPVLGICRGQQLLNVALGGSLIQDIPSQRPSHVPHRQSGPRDALSHAVEVEAGSRLAKLLGTMHLEVNSFHHQAVDRLGRGLRAVAWSTDGIVEGVESEEHPWLVAVQFHPEDLTRHHEPSRRLFRALVEACHPGHNAHIGVAHARTTV